MTILLLTGCINPDGMVYTALQNVEVRKRQYIESINFYLKTTSLQIVFVENSNTDISKYFSDTDKIRVEFITFSGNDFDKTLGKGYGEMQILFSAFNKSEKIRESQHVCKITGRYQVQNITKLLASYDKNDAVIYGHVKEKFHFMDSRIFLAETEFFRAYLQPYMNIVNDSKGIYFEHCLCKATLTSMRDNHIFLPFKYLPRISGQSGTDGNYYKTSFLHWYPRNLIQRLKYFLFKLDL